MREADGAAPPRTRPEATALPGHSPSAKDYLGEAFVEHYAASRDVERRHRLADRAEPVTAFELRRSFDTL